MPFTLRTCAPGSTIAALPLRLVDVATETHYTSADSADFTDSDWASLLVCVICGPLGPSFGFACLRQRFLTGLQLVVRDAPELRRGFVELDFKRCDCFCFTLGCGVVALSRTPSNLLVRRTGVLELRQPYPRTVAR